MFAIANIAQLFAIANTHAKIEVMNSTIEQQRALYGVSLAQRFGEVMEKYALSQRSLAQVLGISAPMLSQLISAKRIKIGNPAVLGRLIMLESRAGEGDLSAVLAQVELLDSAPATQSTANAPEGLAALDYLRSVGSQSVLAELAELARLRNEIRLSDFLAQAAGK